MTKDRIYLFIWGLIFFGLGLGMILNPHLMDGYVPRGRYYLGKKLLVWIWGTPAGVILELIGANTTYHLFRTRKTPAEPPPVPTDATVHDPAPAAESQNRFLRQIPELAATHVAKSKENFDVTFDYSPASLTKIDEVISKHWDHTPVFLKEVAMMFGSYIGETIRRELGGKWVVEDDRYALSEIGGTDTKIYPFEKIQKRFINGEEDSIAHYYTVIRDIVNEQKYGGPRK